MGQELAKDVVAAQDVDLEGEKELLCCSVDDGAASSDTGVVDLQEREVSAASAKSSERAGG
jgi:hypothetical protein